MQQVVKMEIRMSGNLSFKEFIFFSQSPVYEVWFIHFVSLLEKEIQMNG